MSKYSVILVEDELPARAVFRQMIEAREELFELVGEAEDGRDGLELYIRLKPQLIVTDITMPGMNGLEMLREIGSRGEPEPQVVILTCHQDFHYAQQAIRLNAASYLIKDDCLSDPQLLTQTLEELAAKAVNRDESKVKQLQLEQKVRSNELEIEQNIFLDMLRNPAAEPRWLESLGRFRTALESPGLRVLLLELDRSSMRFSIDQPEELKLWQFAGVNVLKELLEGIGPHKVIALDKGRFIGLFAPAVKLDQEGFLGHLYESFAKYLKMNCIALLCILEQGLPEQLRDLKKLAAAPYPFFYYSGMTISAGQWETMNRFAPIPEHYSRFWSKVLKQALLEPHLSPAATEQERSSLYRQAMEQRWEPEQIKSLYLRVFLDISHFTADVQGSAELEAAFRKKLEQSQTFQAVHNSTFAYFRELQHLQGDTRKLDSSISRIIQKLHEDLSYPYKLEELAASINYSVPYFSSMFKKATGESFMQFLTRLRLEKAKLLLLTSDLKTFEIAEAIGFENYRSFNRLFKKETGLTPSDYRKCGITAGENAH